MKFTGIFTCLIVAGLVASAPAQTLTFDFEGITDVSELTDAGWELIDDQGRTVGGVPVQYLDTIQIETTIVHGGSQALRLEVADIAYYPLNGQFGTLDLWVYDFGWHISEYVTTAYGPRWGLRKYCDIDTSGYYPDNEPVDYGVLNRPYGIGAGLTHKSYLGSDGGYACEWGNTTHMDIAVIANAGIDYDPAAPAVNAGWAGDQSWWSPSWFGPYFGIDGRPAGWFHWRIAYLTPGQVEIELLDSPTGSTSSQAQAGFNAFDGTTPGGVSDIFLYGGSTMMDGAEPEMWFDVGIYDDITWTPEGGTICNPGDADGDGDVDLDDFVILKNNFGTATGATCAEGDFDGDGDVDLDDFVLLKNNFGATY